MVQDQETSQGLPSVSGSSSSSSLFLSAAGLRPEPKEFLTEEKYEQYRESRERFKQFVASLR